MTELTQADASLMDLIGRTDDTQVKIPNDIETADDFIAWCRNVEKYPFEPDDIRASLDTIPVDEHGIMKQDLRTASRTFFKGSKREEVLNWISEAFNEKGA